METGSIEDEAVYVSNAGLCYSIIGRTPEMQLFRIRDDGSFRFGYWGFNGEELIDHGMSHIGGVPRKHVLYSFTPLRQTIVLFCAALNNEL